MSDVEPGARPTGDLPDALVHIEEVFRRLGREAMVAFDYDGVLTPIVSDPDAANLTEAMRDRLATLAACCPVGVVSGRDRVDVTNHVALDGIVYAGSHGFDIAGPGGMQYEHAPARSSRLALDEAVEVLGEQLADLGGVAIERKLYAVAVHTRNADDEQGRRTAQAATHAFADRTASLKSQVGKEIVELRPDLDWHKGTAIELLVELLDDQIRSVLYLGDDTTDEDAFVHLRRTGLGFGIFVGPPTDKPTYADYRVDDTDAVADLIDHLTAELRTSRS